LLLLILFVETKTRKSGSYPARAYQTTIIPVINIEKAIPEGAAFWFWIG
jgi:hypothetical protein